MLPAGRRWFSCTALFLVVGCGPSSLFALQAGEAGDSTQVTVESSLDAEARNRPQALDVGTWNLCWYGSTFGGPKDEAEQQRNVDEVLKRLDLDVVALVEVSGAFDTLRASLPEHDLLLAEDARVSNASDFSAPQKTGLALRHSSGSITAARLLFPEHSKTFAGRLPLEVELTLKDPLTNGARELTVVVVHLKAGDDAASWTERANAGLLLEGYVKQHQPSRRLLIAGDFNDDVDGSITPGKESPFASLAANVFLSDELSRAGQTTSLSASQKNMLDHLMVSRSLSSDALVNATEILRPDLAVEGYARTTSDHLPLVTSFAQRGSTASPRLPKVILNELLINEPQSNRDGEFVELVNAGDEDADLSGWTLWDALAARHTFPEGTRLKAHRALAVTKDLSLNNEGDAVLVKDAQGRLVDVLRYTAAAATRDGVSYTRNVDGDPSSPFSLHDNVSSRASSPGMRLDGELF